MNSPKHGERGKESVTLGFLDSMVSLNKFRVCQGVHQIYIGCPWMSMDVHGCPTEMCIMVYLYCLNQSIHGHTTCWPKTVRESVPKKDST